MCNWAFRSDMVVVGTGRCHCFFGPFSICYLLVLIDEKDNGFGSGEKNVFMAHMMHVWRLNSFCSEPTPTKG